jgi:hypothetical protein
MLMKEQGGRKAGDREFEADTADTVVPDLGPRSDQLVGVLGIGSALSLTALTSPLVESPAGPLVPGWGSLVAWMRPQHTVSDGVDRKERTLR